MLHDRLVMSWERSARKQRAWSIIHLILLQSITLHLLYIIWAATCHARPSSHSPMLESDRLPAKHHTLALTQARWQLQRQAAHAHAAPGCSDRHKYRTTSSFCLSDASERDKCDECLPPVLSHRSHRWECFSVEKAHTSQTVLQNS